MTAVAPPPNFQAISRTWNANAPTGLPMSAEDMSRLFMPRKSAQRSNSSSSLSSIASTASAASTPSAANGDWRGKKKWPVKADTPTTRPAAPAISAPIMSPNPTQNGLGRTATPVENTPVLYLTPMNGTFERKTINVPFYPDVLRIGRQTNNKTVPTAMNGYFDSKVLSRQHAEIWATHDGKIFIRDVKSSNGTFVNGARLSPENKDSDPHELREHDMLELGIDIVSEDQKTVVHHKVAARVEHAGYAGVNNGVLDLNFSDLNPSLPNAVGQNLGMRRSNSQTSLASSRISTTSAQFSAPRQQPHFWLTPINMDQIVKKLNVELKAAKQQQHDLQRAEKYIDSILSPDKEQKEKSKPKARFSDPPAPPPQAPLPEKPDARFALQPLLRREETERPKSNSPTSPRVDLGTAGQINSLREALDAAKKDFEAQNARLREAEDRLAQEQAKRVQAEQRAQRLEEKEPEITPQTLQKRLDALLAELGQVQAVAERWRREKEEAERERDEERKERQSLAEMIQRIRAEEADRVGRVERKKEERERKVSQSPKPNRKSKVEKENRENGTPTFTEVNGHAVAPHTDMDTGTSSALVAGRTPTIHHAAPYLSAVSVVLIGVAVMALVNKMQRGER
ncbi:hypothetical protein EJ06DRAFT_143939 [Trichodelitschia bisporula]|uniref:FHA domain-containing protein n=1 Tax=Trichodelitschia bisporula TaxID=703511 RepID=A0A6G1HN96_9PEZI|nr:hypothetical protein EJ06DRAFT_143939 [Trichodelitschia bisporula]